MIGKFEPVDVRNEVCNITYAVARYDRLKNKWSIYCDYEELEEAQEKLAWMIKYSNKRNKYAIFERIQSESLTMLN